MAEPQSPHSRPLLAGVLAAALLAAVGLALVLGQPGQPPETSHVPELAAQQTPTQPQAPAKVHVPWQVPLDERQELFWPTVRRLSEREGMDPALVMAVVHVESRFVPTARSERGARGLMQIDRRTARQLGLTNPLDPEANLRAGIRYLSSLRDVFQGDLTLALAAYNAGPRKVQEAGPAMPDIDETREFVEQVLTETNNFRKRFSRLPNS